MVASWVLINLSRLSRSFPCWWFRASFDFLLLWLNAWKEGVYSLAVSSCWWNFSSPFSRWLFFVRQVVCNSWPPRWVLQCRDTRGLGKLLARKAWTYHISTNTDPPLLSLQLKFELILNHPNCRLQPSGVGLNFHLFSPPLLSLQWQWCCCMINQIRGQIQLNRNFCCFPWVSSHSDLSLMWGEVVRMSSQLNHALSLQPLPGIP